MSKKNVSQSFEFQAEVRQLLDIVINSLYTDREIFVRELISNASDALEKFRHEAMLKNVSSNEDVPLEIRITCDKEEKTFAIFDSGIGMNSDEAVENLGTIAHSGSRAFLGKLKDNEQSVNLIGQFGVGFYSAFMVAEKVTVTSGSAHGGGTKWESEGTGSYTVEEMKDMPRGTKISLKLKENASEFSDPDRVKELVRQYSNFVSFPVYVNEEKVNTVDAIWTKNKSEITDEAYTEFYRFIGNAWDEPFYRLHFSADAPLDIKSILFVPKSNIEKFGFGRTEPGVNLYCRKVLIEQHSKDILPEWLRFLKGVIDSEDLPLNISRETMQDRSLIAKLKKTITRRFLKHLDEEAGKDSARYTEFFQTFGNYLKEGLVSGQTSEFRDELIPLLRFESSALESGKMTSLDEYISRMPETQKEIYFAGGPSRSSIEAGPYIEGMKKKGFEVLFTYEVIDDFVLTSVAEYKEKKVVSAESAEIEIETEGNRLEAQAEEKLCLWLKDVFGDRVAEVKPSRRLTDSPAVLVAKDGHVTSSMKKVLQAMHRDTVNETGMYALEVNSGHQLIHSLSDLREKNPELGKLLAGQLLDNSRVSAGLLTEPREMVERIYKIMGEASRNVKC